MKRLMAFILILGLLTACAAKPQDPFLAALQTAAKEADLVVMHHSNGPDDWEAYRRITDRQTVKDLAEEVPSHLGETDRGGGWAGNDPVSFTFYRQGEELLSITFPGLNQKLEEKARLRLDDTWQWYRFAGNQEFAQRYWALGIPVEEGSVPK